MSWEEHFQKLINLKQERKDKNEHQKKEEIAARVQLEKELAKEFGPQIEKVCKGFAKVVGWKYEKFGESLFECNSRHPYGRDFGYEIIVVPERDAIHVRCYYRPSSDNFSSWEELRTIPLDEFTEEKLANIFEDLARKCRIL